MSRVGVVALSYYLIGKNKMNRKTKGINKPKYCKVRQDQIHKKSNYNSYVPEEFKGLPTMERVKRVALRDSDNKRCWWIYQYIINSYGRK